MVNRNRIGKIINPPLAQYGSVIPAVLTNSESAADDETGTAVRIEQTRYERAVQGKCTFIGTVKGRNRLWKTYEDARGDPEFYAALLPASKTGLLSNQELAAARKDMGDAQYFSEFECDPTSPIIGAYFGQEMKDCDVEGRLEPNLAIINGPVHTAWDLGNQSNMAVWCFQAGDEGLRIIDFISRPGLLEDKLVNLTPGMAITVEIKTGSRRVIEYLLSPLLRYKQESLRER